VIFLFLFILIPGVFTFHFFQVERKLILQESNGRGYRDTGGEATSSNRNSLTVLPIQLDHYWGSEYKVTPTGTYEYYEYFSANYIKYIGNIQDMMYDDG
jgi:hypothetical protein